MEVSAPCRSHPEATFYCPVAATVKSIGECDDSTTKSACLVVRSFVRPYPIIAPHKRRRRRSKEPNGTTESHQTTLSIPFVIPAMFRLCSWDLRTRRCVERFRNEDGTITSSISVTPNHIAVGAESGVVNLYSDAGSSAARKAPLKSLMNLQTSADCTRFNHDGNILAFSTKREREGLKLLHVPSQTVFSNWPTAKTPLKYVWSLDFSPMSKFLTIGNDKGECLLYKLEHYHAQ